MPQVKVTFNRNVKYGNERYVENAKLSVSKEEYEALFKSGVVGEVDDVPGDEPEDVDYLTFSREQLGKVKNDDLKAFLDKESLVYEDNFTKPQLINVILGEEA
ncbi:hypothetical protein [Paenisporosarcina sp. OV554]|uniref:hypothetical protein n=1 Tax=Paenisporosarcina sp. OV554 TaxID=2135694 RepID=UPI000D3C4659|nr:hypothetical protein [Paenisporosarcina sp. OV554]PUB12620.1 hypothetical protein C8K15_109119 [Paenisporosarcina sp. OV554]